MIQVSSMFNTPPPPILHQGHQGASAQTSNVSQQFQPLQFKPFKPPDGEFDGKRLRKSVMRKTVDYNSSVLQMLEARIWQRDERDRPALPPDICYASHVLPPPAYLTNPINAVVSKFVRTSTNKAKCPIFCLAWTPEGRRLVTGASSGEFTLWNGLTFNFETILQAHESSVRAMIWSNNDQWMVTGDTSGYVKYWQSNMNNVKMFQAHKDPVRGLSFSPSDLKLATGSDDGTVRIWDFFRCQEERVLRGHGADVKCVDWHPSKSLLASGSKDNQQPIKLWDPRSGTSLAKLHAHKSTVMDLKWNANGNWLCSASRDHLLKLFDIRNFSTELQVFRGHKKEASSIAWHPQHEGLFASGGSDGSILFWHVGNDKEVGAIEAAHDGIIWDLAWHPLGHLLCSGSNDHTSKFWTRNRPGDKMRDKYNLNTLPPGVVGDDCVDIDDIPVSASYIPSAAIPGMGPDDKVEAEPEPKGPETIPGLDFDSLTFDRFMKKTPYAKPIPKTFQAAWNAAGGLDEDMEDDQSITSWVIVESENLFSKPAHIEGDPVITDLGEELPPGSVPLSEIKANAIAYFGFYIPLPRVSGDRIQDAFAFYDEEEALAEITADPEFARKLVREKKGLYNPSTNQGSEDFKPDMKEDLKLKENVKQFPMQQNEAYHHNFGGGFHKGNFNNFPNNNFANNNGTSEGYRDGAQSQQFKRAPGNFPQNFNQNFQSNFNQGHFNQNNFGQQSSGLQRVTDFQRGGSQPQRFPNQGSRGGSQTGDRGRGFNRTDGGDRGRGYNRDGDRGGRGFNRGESDRNRGFNRNENNDRGRNFRGGSDRGFNREGGNRGFNRDNAGRNFKRDSTDGSFFREGSSERFRDGGDVAFVNQVSDNSYGKDVGDRTFNRDGADRNFCRDGDRDFGRDSGDRGFSRENDRSMSRDDSERSYSRDSNDRGFNRDSSDRGFSREAGDRNRDWSGKGGRGRGFSRGKGDFEFEDSMDENHGVSDRKGGGWRDNRDEDQHWTEGDNFGGSRGGWGGRGGRTEGGFQRSGRSRGRGVQGSSRARGGSGNW